MREVNASGQYELRDISKTQAESEAQPHAMANNLRKEAVPLLTDRDCDSRGAFIAASNPDPNVLQYPCD
jgi:hypothetical protein